MSEGVDGKDGIGLDMKAFHNTVKALLDHGLDTNRGLQIIEGNTIPEIKYQLDSYQSFNGPWLCILQAQPKEIKK